jgi:hypothetical protein
VPEVVRHPGSKKLTKCNGPELGMPMQKIDIAKIEAAIQGT